VIVLVVASGILLAALQDSIAAPTQSFRGCLRDAAAKATSEKVSGDAIEAYLRNACSGEMSTLKSAIIAFRVKNGMAKKAAASDADMTVDDYVATPVDNYQFMAAERAPKPSPAPPPVTPASNPQQPKE
jgi:hypothetical protein